MKLTETLTRTGKAIEEAFMPSLQSNPMDILDKLKMEHEEVKDLLEELVGTTAATPRKKILSKIKMALVPHVRAEEKVVYDAIIALREKDAKVDGEEGYMEHGLADRMLATLAKISDAASPEFTAGAKVLKELIEHHVEEEERNVWKDIRENFDGEQRTEMYHKFISAKKKVRIV